MIVGPNGSGKTTLLECVLGLRRPDRGTISLSGRTLYSSERKLDVPAEERRLGYVPQSYALFPHMSVVENVQFGIDGPRGPERRARAMALLEEVGIPHLSNRRTTMLSGGESQRVALARALAIGPAALLLDEPLAALDADARQRLRAFLVEHLEGVGVPTIIVTHDAEDVRALGGRTVVLEGGQVVQCGPLEVLRDRPATPFVARLFGAP